MRTHIERLHPVKAMVVAKVYHIQVLLFDDLSLKDLFSDPNVTLLLISDLSFIRALESLIILLYLNKTFLLILGLESSLEYRLYFYL